MQLTECIARIKLIIFYPQFQWSTSSSSFVVPCQQERLLSSCSDGTPPLLYLVLLHLPFNFTILKKKLLKTQEQYKFSPTMFFIPRYSPLACFKPTHWTGAFCTITIHYILFTFTSSHIALQIYWIIYPSRHQTMYHNRKWNTTNVKHETSYMYVSHFISIYISRCWWWLKFWW